MLLSAKKKLNGQKSLVIHISTDPEPFASLNYNKKLKNLKMLEVPPSHIVREITVIESLAVSQLVFLLSPLRSKYNVSNEINDLLFTLL